MFVIVVGGGKVGAHLAALLLAGGHRVKLVEQSAAKVELLRNELQAECVVHGSGTNPIVLETIGARQADVLAAVTGADEVNAIVASLAKFEFGLPRCIVRVNNPKNDWLFTKDLGVDVALNQADLMAHLIAEEMSLGDMITLLKLRKGQFSLVEEKLTPESQAVGKAVGALKLPDECVLTAIIRGGQLLMPRDTTVLRAGDEVLAVVHAGALLQLAQTLH